jgi:hypothetical protein
MSRTLSFLVSCSIAGALACDIDENNPQFRKDMAIETAKEYVLQRLKAPATAQWPRGSANYSCTELGNDRFKVISFVDAQNTFGANIRTSFAAVVKYEGNGQWSLESLETQP